MNNAYVEKIVKKKSTPQTALIRILSALSVVIVSYVIMVLMGLIYGLLVIAAGACLVYYVFLNTSIEYEFILVKSELSIEAIYGKNRRKMLHTFDVSKCEIIAPADSTYVAGYHKNEQMKSLDYTSGIGEEPVYILLVSYGAESAKLYMEFNDRMLEAMRLAAPGKVKTQ